MEITLPTTLFQDYGTHRIQEHGDQATTFISMQLISKKSTPSSTEEMMTKSLALLATDAFGTVLK